MSCSIKVRGTLQYVGRVHYRLADWSQPIWFALQGVIELYESGDVLDLTAGTYKGCVSETRILAFNVNAIVPPVCTGRLKRRAAAEPVSGRGFRWRLRIRHLYVSNTPSVGTGPVVRRAGDG